MKKKDNKFKITPEVRKSIREAAAGLPPIPVFIEKPNGEWVPQLIKETKIVSKLNEETGKEALFIHTDRNVRMVNHEVYLNQIYKLLGPEGIYAYSVKVIEFEQRLNPTPAEETPTEVQEEVPHAVEPSND